LSYINNSKLYIKYYQENNGDYLFNFKLESPGNLVESLNQQIIYMQKIAIKHTEFTWEFDGMNLVCICLIPTTGKYKKSFVKFYGINGFIKSLTLYLKELAGISSSDYLSNKHVTINKYIIGWRRNQVTGMLPVEISPFDDVDMILKKSLIGSREIGIFKLNPIKWKFLFPVKQKKTFKEIDLNNLPDCIKTILNKPNKTKFEINYLTRFLLSIYSPEDTKLVLNMIGDNSEYYNVITNLENCGCPNCRDLSEYCNNCDKPHPLC